VSAPGQRYCIVCEREFYQYTFAEEAKRCPTCSDLLQNRPTVCAHRAVVARFRNVEVYGLPFPWTFVEKHRKQDFPHYKMEIIGRNLRGAETGEQRIVIRAASAFPQGSVVDVRVMKATHIGPPVHASRTGTKKPSPKVFRRTYVSLDPQYKRGSSADSQIIYNVFYGDRRQVLNKSLWSAVTTGKGQQDIAAIIAVVNDGHPVAIDDGNRIANFP
jgi:hypothetical protein